MKYAIILLLALIATCYAELECPPDGDFPTYHPDPESCRYFYECSNGYLNKFDCGECLVFNDDEKVCDHPSNVPRCNQEGCLEPEDEFELH